MRNLFYNRIEQTRNVISSKPYFKTVFEIIKLSTKRTPNEKLTEREQVVTITLTEVRLAGFPNSEKKASFVRFLNSGRTQTR